MGNSKKAIYYPTADAEVGSYYDNVVKKLVLLAVKYGIPAELISKLLGYNTDIPAAKLKSDADQQTAKASVKAKDDLYLQARAELLRELKRITDLPNFDEADAMDLGIRRESTAKVVTEVQAIVSGLTVLPGEVIIDWVKGKMDGVVIYASADGANFDYIGKDMRSPFEDRRPNKTAGQPEVRYYRLRYLKYDEEVGQYSDVVSTTVLI
jgi:hypothetical protein